ncbi:DUF4367 domain-containing protein [Guptibacillus spartinae]|uniref:DUF4367 domain-containing protein n=1 Tax=Guptibacillus spartinae TaxID=3025679 RepID=UPI00235F5DE7|nr:DUF4367 domain-containing protein [Pseudalkalibacillus spartinae]
MNNIKEEFKKIEIPNEINNRVSLGVHQAKSEKMKKKRTPKWLLGAVASVMILGTGFTFGGSYIAGAAETLFNQLFDSRQNFEEAHLEKDPEFYHLFDQSLALAEEVLTEEEFAAYIQLLKEQFEIQSEIRKENREPTGEEAARLHRIMELERSYESEFALKEAQQLASYSITTPTYLPEGYRQDNESFSIEKKGEEPVIELDFSNGEYKFSTDQLGIDKKHGLEEYTWKDAKESESYSLNGIEFFYVKTEENFTGMRVTLPEKGYKIIMSADNLSKKEMEKVLLSMVERQRNS